MHYSPFIFLLWQVRKKKNLPLTEPGCDCVQEKRKRWGLVGVGGQITKDTTQGHKRGQKELYKPKLPPLHFPEAQSLFLIPPHPIPGACWESRVSDPTPDLLN